MFGKEAKVGAYIDTRVVVIDGPYTGKSGRISDVVFGTFTHSYSIMSSSGEFYGRFKLWQLRTQDGRKLKAI